MIRIHRAHVWALTLSISAALLSGCADKLKQENADLWDQNKELQGQLDSNRSALEAQSSELARMQAELAAKQAAAAADNSGAGGAFGGIADGNVGVVERGNEATLTIEGDVLFDSGQATVKSTFRSKLSQIASRIRQYPSATIRVEGHSDSDPIKKSKWRDNYHLSEARAIAVRDVLAGHGVPRNMMSIVGHGPDNPVASNSSRANKAKNRRVEIIVVR